MKRTHSPETLPVTDVIAEIGAPGAQFDPRTGRRTPAAESDARSNLVAEVIMHSANAGVTKGVLFNFAGYGRGYGGKRGPAPQNYNETEAVQHEQVVNARLNDLCGLSLARLGWLVIPGESRAMLERFSGSTAEEAYRIDEVYTAYLEEGGEGDLPVVCGPAQMGRLVRVSGALDLAMTSRLVPVLTSGEHENPLMNAVAGKVYDWAILRRLPAAEPADMMTEIVQREAMFAGASVPRKLAVVALGPTHLSPAGLAIPG